MLATYRSNSDFGNALPLTVATRSPVASGAGAAALLQAASTSGASRATTMGV
jgi:hypothetical protein